MLLVSFNVNGIRARMHQITRVLNDYQPDAVGLQEIKVQDSEFPIDDIRATGYHVSFYGQKSHYGVAILSKRPLRDVVMGLPDDDEQSQRRLIRATIDTDLGPISMINGYFPQGESRDHPLKFPHKRAFYQQLNQLLGSQYKPDDRLAVMGDFNIAFEDKDIGIGEDSAKRWLRTGKSSFLPEERDWYQKIIDWGLLDSYRLHYPQKDDLYSWFDYRSKGFDREPRRGLRIDHILVTETLSSHSKDAGIDYEIRSMEKPSDHCPIWSRFE